VEARNHEIVHLVERIIRQRTVDFASPSTQRRIEEDPFSGNGDDTVRKLMPLVESASVEPAPCCDFIDQLERAEKDKKWDEVEALYTNVFRFMAAVAVDNHGSAPANDADRGARIGFHRLAAHLKMSIADRREVMGRQEESRTLRREASDHLQRALYLIHEPWSGSRPLLWRVTRLKLATNYALLRQTEIEGQHSDSDEMLDNLANAFAEINDKYDWRRDLLWYARDIVPAIHHYPINLFEFISVYSRKDRKEAEKWWEEAYTAVADKGDPSKVRADFISYFCQKSIDQLSSFKFHFEQLAAYNRAKSTNRSSP
jgi:hypothetical protein